VIGEFSAWLDRGRTGLCEGLPAEASRVGAEEAKAALLVSDDAVMGILDGHVCTCIAAVRNDCEQRSVKNKV
jgi:hypothetical protein